MTVKRGNGIGIHYFSKDDELITLAVPSDGKVRYKFASLLEYCKSNNKELNELTTEEKKQFEIIREEVK